MRRQPSVPAGLGVRHPALRALLARWCAHRGSAAMPSRDDLPFINLEPWRGHVRRVEIGGGSEFRVLPCAHARIEFAGPFLERDYRQAALTGVPVRTAIEGDETLILPFSGPGRRTELLLVGRYATLAKDADEGRNQQREQRPAHERLARRALEKA